MVRLLALLALAGIVSAKDGVVLKSGKVLAGRVVGKKKMGGKIMLAVETDFGTIHVESGAVGQKPRGAPPTGVFVCRRIRVLRIRGLVERRAEGSRSWHKVALKDRYGVKVNTPNALVKPGDTVRTGDDGSIDLMPHTGVWIRIAPRSRVFVPKRKGGASIELQKGKTLQRIRGQPRGQIFKVRTPTTVCAVKGTFFSLAVLARQRLLVSKGEVEVAGRGTVEAGQSGGWSGDEPLKKRSLSAKEKAELEVEILLPPRDDMVYVPPGTYTMGRTGLISRAGSPDAPTRKVVLSGFLIDRREVTHDEYARYAAAMEDGLPAQFLEGKPPQGHERKPVHGVTWDQASAFARWCGKRLPTEAQWEAAARGPKAFLYPWGNRPLADGAIFLGTTKEWDKLPDADAKTRDLSPFGCKAMVSNVSEWCRDWYRDDAYTTGRARDPKGPSTGIWRVVRGNQNHAIKRWRLSVSDVSSGAGIRCVRELD